jgi:hypothetical protein
VLVRGADVLSVMEHVGDVAVVCAPTGDRFGVVESWLGRERPTKPTRAGCREQC